MSNEHNTSKKPKIAPYQHPLLNALGWVFLFLVAACLGLVLFYICSEDIGVLFGAKDSLWTIDNSIKIVIGIFALFAFVVTIWRGNLHAQQVSAQMEQLMLGREQLEKTEDNNNAKLLIDGTKLLGRDTSEAEKMAGIACLRNIIEGQSKFDKQAVEILQRFIVSFDDKTLHGAGYKPISKVVDYKLFIGDKQEFDNVFAALSALERYGELKQEFVHLNGCIAIKGRHPSAHYRWLDIITWYETKFYQEELVDTAIYINCNFIDCVLSGDAIFARNNTFQEVFFYTFAIDRKKLKTICFSQPTDDKVKCAMNKNSFADDNWYNKQMITNEYQKEFLEYCGVKASDPKTFEAERPMEV